MRVLSSLRFGHGAGGCAAQVRRSRCNPPPCGEGRRRRRRGGGRRCRAPSPPPPARHSASKTRVNALMTRRPPHKGEGKTEYASRTVLIKSSCHAGTLHRSGAMLSGARPPVSPSTPGKVRGGEAPAGAGADRRTRWPALRSGRSLAGQPAHDADRHAFRRFTAAFWCRAVAAAPTSGRACEPDCSGRPAELPAHGS